MPHTNLLAEEDCLIFGLQPPLKIGFVEKKSLGSKQSLIISPEFPDNNPEQFTFNEDVNQFNLMPRSF